MFQEALKHMHHVYCCSDAVIHLHSDPPPKDDAVHTATLDIRKLDLVQIGSLVQVVGLLGQVPQDGPAVFDIMSEINGVQVSFVQEIEQVIPPSRRSGYPKFDI